MVSISDGQATMYVAIALSETLKPTLVHWYVVVHIYGIHLAIVDHVVYSSLQVSTMHAQLARKSCG